MERDESSRSVIPFTHLKTNFTIGGGTVSGVGRKPFEIHGGMGKGAKDDAKVALPLHTHASFLKACAAPSCILD